VIYAEFFLADNPSRKRLKKSLIFAGGLLGIMGGFLGAISQGRDTYTLWSATTGGDGYCYLTYLLANEKTLEYAAAVEGANPQFDVTMRVVDHNALLRLRGDLKSFVGRPSPEYVERFERLQAQTTVEFTVGNVHQYFMTKAWNGPIPTDPLQDYYVFVEARNGGVQEELLLQRKNDGTYTYGLRVWKPNGKIVGGWRKMDIVKEDVLYDFRNFFPSGIPWTLNPN
jgi:hypothetical protein